MYRRTAGSLTVASSSPVSRGMMGMVAEVLSLAPLEPPLVVPPLPAPPPAPPFVFEVWLPDPPLPMAVLYKSFTLSQKDRSHNPVGKQT